MGGGREQEAEAVSKVGYSSGDLPPSAPPHLQGQDPQQYQYGTFQQPPHHAASGELSRPPVWFPQPAPPPGFGGGGGGGHYHHHHHQQPYAPVEPYYLQGYQAVPGYGPIVEGRPVRMPHLPCCGLGLGWLLETRICCLHCCCCNCRNCHPLGFNQRSTRMVSCF